MPTDKKARRIQLFKKRVEKLKQEGRDYSTQPVLGLDAVVGKSGLYQANEQELIIVMDILSSFVSLEGNIDRLLGYCRRRHYYTKSQNYSRSTKKTGRKKITRSYLWRMLTSAKLLGYCIVIDHDDVFPELQLQGKRLVFPLAHKGVIPADLAIKVKEILLSKFNHSI